MCGRKIDLVCRITLIQYPLCMKNIKILYLFLLVKINVTNSQTQNNLKVFCTVKVKFRKTRNTECIYFYFHHYSPLSCHLMRCLFYVLPHIYASHVILKTEQESPAARPFTLLFVVMNKLNYLPALL